MISEVLFRLIGGITMKACAFHSTENTDKENVPETSTPKQNEYNDNSNVTLQLKEEQLDIAKKWIQTGEVRVYRETFTENKSFTVPITHEELVIENKALTPASSEQKGVPIKSIRIPISEEQVEFTKHKVALEDVSIYKQTIEDIKHIEETLNREVSKVNVTGTLKRYKL
jgi:uncharacterized protein (TIGR02271 family)